MLNWSFDNVAFLFYLIPALIIYRALAYWHRAQVAWLALSGMLFYMVLQWQYWIILFGSGLFAFWAVQRMASIRDEQWRYRLAVVGVVLHIIPLLIYKYSATILNTLGAWWHINGSDTHSLWPTWALPLGISFFTFQLMAYWIDVYQENIEPETDVIAFMAYLFFFPKLLSGPITRVQQLMPQIHAKQGFDMALASEGLTQWAWGLFKKRIISDTAVLYVHQVFQPNSAAAGGDYWLVCFLFPIQV
jgi:D-alanyl-lipoteichoic acid acyltransferase DltB (MBOAT superfamily)